MRCRKMFVILFVLLFGFTLCVSACGTDSTSSDSDKSYSDTLDKDTSDDDTSDEDTSDEDTSDEDTSDDTDTTGLEIYQSSYSNTETTNSTGGAVLDTQSFDRDVKIQLKKPVQGLNVDYEQNEGVATIDITDPDKIYAPIHLQVDLTKKEYDSSKFVVTTGTIIVIGKIALTAYTAYKVGTNLYKICDIYYDSFDKVKWSDGEGVVETTMTVSELVDLTIEMIDLGINSFAFAKAAKFTISGTKVVAKKAVKTKAKSTTRKKVLKIVKTIIKRVEDTQESIGADSTVSTRYVFKPANLRKSGSPSFIAGISLETKAAATNPLASLKIAHSPEDPEPGQDVTATVKVYDPEDSVTLEGIKIDIEVVGTDGYTFADDPDKDTILYLDANGEATFTVPGATSGVKDQVTVEASQLDLTVQETWTF